MREKKSACACTHGGDGQQREKETLADCTECGAWCGAQSHNQLNHIYWFILYQSTADTQYKDS